MINIMMMETLTALKPDIRNELAEKSIYLLTPL